MLAAAPVQAQPAVGVIVSFTYDDGTFSDDFLDLVATYGARTPSTFLPGTSLETYVKLLCGSASQANLEVFSRVIGLEGGSVSADGVVELAQGADLRLPQYFPDPIAELTPRMALTDTTFYDYFFSDRAGATIEQIGSPLDFYDRPANVFVAGFIGSPSMNFLAGTMTAAGFALPDGTVLPVPTQTETAVTYGIRPEHLKLDPEGFSAQVVVVEPMGSETQVVMRFGEQPIVGIFRERVRAKPGDILKVSIAPDDAHLFDGKEDRIQVEMTP